MSITSKVISKYLSIFTLEGTSILNPRILNALMIVIFSLDVLGPVLFDM